MKKFVQCHNDKLDVDIMDTHVQKDADALHTYTIILNRLAYIIQETFSLEKIEGTVVHQEILTYILCCFILFEW